MVCVAIFALLAGMSDDRLPLVRVDRDNIQIFESCRVEVTAPTILDSDDNGVIHITGDGIEVLLEGEVLRGASDDKAPNEYKGIGIRVTGRRVTIRGGSISGYKVALYATRCDGTTIEGLNTTDNFRQRLRSTPQREDASDWLWPHANDNKEWLTNYGAGIYIEDTDSVVVRNVVARHVQNGIILDRVNNAQIYDNDCSFLSGWGLALWRSNSNVISRNSFDFCIRGYSHGVYNRGQDSAGILMFEQCSSNVIAENSATHCGDGLFAFAGKEALGEVNPRDSLAWYAGRGNTNNLFFRNDFSYAAAHGLELTFSHGNAILNNRIDSNAICGIWAGYSQRTEIAMNMLSNNGDRRYGLECGGVNIEHGELNRIIENTFVGNRCGIHLWWDDDAAIFELPWFRANYAEGVSAALIVRNLFRSDEIGLHLRNLRSPVEVALNRFDGVTLERQLEGSIVLKDTVDLEPSDKRVNTASLAGRREALGARRALQGREHIIMTEWGPWDHASPLALFVRRFDHADEYKILGTTNALKTEAILVRHGDVLVELQDDRVRIIPNDRDTWTRYQCTVDIDGTTLTLNGTLTGGAWTVQTFPSMVDPRVDAEAWRREGLACSSLHTATVDPLDLPFAHGGMTELKGLPVVLPRDYFGTIATRTLRLPAGAWRIRTLSDDGIRVWLDDELIIDDWTWHAPREHVWEFTLDQPKACVLRVEHFELDGYAVLKLDFEPAAR